MNGWLISRRMILTRSIWTFALLLMGASLAWSQTDVRYYLVPKVGDGRSPATAFRPKYFQANELGQGWTVGTDADTFDYGDEATYLAALNLSPTGHTTLTAQADVIAIPAPITDNVAAGAINTIKNKLEGAHLPADWVTTALTYKQVIGTVYRLAYFMQQYQGLGFGRFFDLIDKNSNPITLDTTFQNLTAAEKTRLQQAAQRLGLDTSGFTAQSTIRQILKGVADQILPNGFVFGGTAFN